MNVCEKLGYYILSTDLHHDVIRIIFLIKNYLLDACAYVYVATIIISS